MQANASEAKLGRIVQSFQIGGVAHYVSRKV
jgi:hypothetical protein